MRNRLALVLRIPDQPPNTLDVTRRQLGELGLIGGLHGAQNRVQAGIRDTHLTLVRLGRMVTGSGYPIKDNLWETVKGHCERVHLVLVVLKQGLDVHPSVAPLGEVTGHRLRLVSRPTNKPVLTAGAGLAIANVEIYSGLLRQDSY